jgi:hypothetical protein
VATNANQAKLYVFKLGQNEPYTLFDEEPVSDAMMADDNTLWYTKEVHQGLYKINLNTNAQPVQVLDEQIFSVKFNWTVTAKGLYYLHNYTDHQRINHYDFASKTVSSKIMLPPKTVESLGSITIIPELDKLIFSQSPYPQVDIKRLKHPLLL